MPITPASITALAAWRARHRAAGVRVWKRPDNGLRQHYWLQARLDNEGIRNATPVEVGWLAALLEGEGCFYTRSSRKDKRTVLVQVNMSDRDIVERAAVLMGGTVRVHTPAKTNRKAMYVTFRSGPGALEIMLAIYPHMGIRRRAKIDEIVGLWERAG